MYSDKRRSFITEAVKRLVVQHFGGAVVAGPAQREYLVHLGMRLEQTFIGYDVVDNEYFSSAAAEARRNADTLRRSLQLPRDYFLANSRFIQKKNLCGLLSEYGLYRQSAAKLKAGLVIVGDGPLREQVRQLARELDLDDYVLFVGTKTYLELPPLYALARAFVHASTTEQWGLVVNEAMASGLPVAVSDRCGCAANLVSPGVNGFTFNPSKRGDLAACLELLSGDSGAVAKMGRRSQAIVAYWSPDLFAVALGDACRLAVHRGASKIRWADQALLSLLSRRQHNSPD
jgi:glycosyltransferase involved in cell wall biosynthesis